MGISFRGEALTPAGMIGQPDFWARKMEPGWTRRLGPRGPSGVKARVAPAFKCRVMVSAA